MHHQRSNISPPRHSNMLLVSHGYVQSLPFAQRHPPHVANCECRQQWRANCYRLHLLLANLSESATSIWFILPINPCTDKPVSSWDPHEKTRLKLVEAAWNNSQTHLVPTEAPSFDNWSKRCQAMSVRPKRWRDKTVMASCALLLFPKGLTSVSLSSMCKDMQDAYPLNGTLVYHRVDFENLYFSLSMTDFKLPYQFQDAVLNFISSNNSRH